MLREDLDRFEIGIVVSDIESSRAFYRDMVGLEELRPEEDPAVGATKYVFRHGTTTINLYSFRPDSPKDLETAGMQYIVWNVVGSRRGRESARCDDRPPAVGTRADAHDLASGSGRREQLLRGVRGQRQHAAAPVTLISRLPLFHGQAKTVEQALETRLRGQLLETGRNKTRYVREGSAHLDESL